MSIKALKIIFSKKRVIFFKGNQKINLFNLNKTFILAGGNRFIKRNIQIFDLGQPIGLYCLTRKPFSKPVNRLKLRV